MDKPLVSIIIPTYNSEGTIEVCLRSIKKQTYTNIEIIVVDNYSDDRTVEIAKVYGARVLFKGPERSAQRNFGAKHAHGKYLLFIDSDMELTPKVVEECVRCILKGYDAIIIPEITVGKGYWAKVRALERAAYIGNTLFEAARFFKREVFEKLGGYDETLTGPEDYDLQARLEKAHYRVGYIAAYIIHHEGKVRLLPYLRKRLYYSRSLKRYAKKHPERAKQQLGLIRATIYLKVLRKNPRVGIGVFLLKGLEYIISKIVSMLEN